MYYAIAILIAIGVFMWIFSQNQRIQQFRQEQIQRNNLISKESIEEPVLNGLKPQIINIKDKKQTLYLPEEFTINVLAQGLKSPQLIKSDDKGNVFVTDNGSNTLWILPVSNPREPKKVDTNLNNIYGLAWYKGIVYITTDTKVMSYSDIQSDGSYKERKTLIDNIPKPQQNNHNTIALSKDRIYIGVSANCESCKVKDQRRGSIISFNLEGKDEQLFARGLKQITDILPVENDLLVTDIGRSGIDKGLPLVEINKVSEGKDYGWPYCYGSGNIDPKYPDKTDFCKTKAESSIAELPQGNNVIGFTAIDEKFYAPFKGNYAFVYQGGQSKSIPKGYKIVIKDINKSSAAKNFITGWLSEEGEIWGQPTGITFDNTNSMLITDQKNGVVYKVSKQ
jgi:glucose/arabinose dehydrogenase